VKAKMKTVASNFRKLLATVGIVTAFACSLPIQVRAQATVIKGEMSLPGEFPFFTMPGDPFVIVFAEAVLDVRFISDGSGGLHILVKEIKETLSATVAGTAYDYELLGLQSLNPSANNINAKGLYASTVRYSFSLLRIDPSTSAPLALIDGKGTAHVTISSDGKLNIVWEKIDWTITPL
jgi:hypothetical protein